MKDFIKEFCKRGMLFAWLGPVILCIVWACLNQNGVITELPVPEIIKNVLTIILMAFIAAGISAVYTLEQLPYLFAALIQMAVLYVDYLMIYLLNGWVPANSMSIMIFTVIFLIGLGIIWAIIYFTTKRVTERINHKLDHSAE